MDAPRHGSVPQRRRLFCTLQSRTSNGTTSLTDIPMASCQLLAVSTYVSCFILGRYLIRSLRKKPDPSEPAQFLKALFPMHPRTGRFSTLPCLDERELRSWKMAMRITTGVDPVAGKIQKSAHISRHHTGQFRAPCRLNFKALSLRLEAALSSFHAIKYFFSLSA